MFAIKRASQVQNGCRPNPTRTAQGISSGDRDHYATFEPVVRLQKVDAPTLPWSGILDKPPERTLTAHDQTGPVAQSFLSTKLAPGRALPMAWT